MRHCVKRALCVLVSISILFTLVSVLTLSTTASSNKCTAIAVGNNFIVVQTTAGEVWGWGDNINGVLGTAISNETNTDITAPVKISLPNGVNSTAISAGFDHVLCLGSDGNVYAWGNNAFGQLGVTVSNDVVRIPTCITSLSDKNIIAISAGKQFSLALSSDGTVYSFGKNDKGQLGYEFSDDSAEFSATPTQIPALNEVTIAQISAGYESALAIDEDGKAYLWGSTEHYVLGEKTNSGYKLPSLYSTSKTEASIVSAALNEKHSAFLLEDGKIGFLGSNDYSQFGNGETGGEASALKVVDISSLNATTSAISDQQTVLLSSDGKVYTAGNRLPNNAESASDTFVLLFEEEEKTATAIAAGYQNAAMIASDGSVWVWGSNSNGQLGNGTSGNGGQATPSKVFGSDDFSYIMSNTPQYKDVPITVKTTVPAPTYSITIPQTIQLNELRQTTENAENRFAWVEFQISSQNVSNLFGEKSIQVSVEPGNGQSFCLQDGNGNTIPFELFDCENASNAISDGILKEFTESDQTEGTWIRVDQSIISKSGIYTGTLIFRYSVVDITDENN